MSIIHQSPLARASPRKGYRTFDLGGAVPTYSLVIDFLDFCFLGRREGERVAEVVFFGCWRFGWRVLGIRGGLGWC